MGDDAPGCRSAGRALASSCQRARIAGHVGGQDRGQAALDAWDRCRGLRRRYLGGEEVAALEQLLRLVRSLTEAIDTTSSGGRLVFQLFAALAEFEIIRT